MHCRVVPILLIDFIPDLLPVRQFLTPLNRIPDSFGQTTLLRNLGETDTYHLFRVIGGKGCSQHCGNEHFPVYPVLDVGDNSIAVGELGGLLRPAGAYIAQDIGPNLGTYPLAEGIAVRGGLRWQYLIDQIAVGYPFRGVYKIVRQSVKPRIGYV